MASCNLAIALNDVQEAAKRIKGATHITPVMTSDTVNEMAGNSLFFKCELFQKTGSFKFRGAMNAVKQLNEEQRKVGVVTHSSGNHAQALALAGKLEGVAVTVVMPENSPEIKVKAVKGYGATVVFCGNDPAERERVALNVAGEQGSTLIPSFNHPHIMAGQGTLVLELLDQVEAPLDFLIVPIGGGGLMSGCSVACKGLSPATVIIGAEPKGADDAWQSMEAGKLIPQTNPQTVADGLRTSMGPLTWEVIRNNVDEIITVSESDIKQYMRLVWERMKLCIEPSAGVGVAVAFSEQFRTRAQGKRVGIVLCGGNLDITKWSFE